LLTRNAGDEPAAADFTACFESPQDAQQLAPRRKPRRLALEDAPEHDAVTPQQRVGDVLDDFVLGSVKCAAGREFRRRGAAEPPASRGLDSEERRAAAPLALAERLATIGRREQRAQAREAVGVHES